MPIEIIQHQHNKYPKFQSEGYAAQFAIPYAKHVCKGIGVDIGCNRLEWMYAGSLVSNPTKPRLKVQYKEWLAEAIKDTTQPAHSFPIDPVINGFEAMKFPKDCSDLDYVFSSHCLEHIPDWVTVLDSWYDKLKPGGVMFLYLPGFSQSYWRPWHNRKHLHIFEPHHMWTYFRDKGYQNIFYTQRDLNDAFMIMGEKPTPNVDKKDNK